MTETRDHGTHAIDRDPRNVRKSIWCFRGFRVAMFTSVLSLVMLLSGARTATQVRHASGQNVVPVFEGWERNADGSFTMVFGYMNRNYEEEVDVPIGANNAFEPRAADEGQPTHFYPRRQQFMFRVKVPSDWGKRDLVWRITWHGKTEKAYGSLWPVWEIDRNMYQQNRGGPGELGEPDDPPSIALVGAAQRMATVGQPLTIAVTVTDDGRPTPKPSRSGTSTSSSRTPSADRAGPLPQNPVRQAIIRLDPSMRLGVIWVVHRRSVPGAVSFDPMKVAVVDGKAATKVTFSQPGNYTIRGYADDGILLDSADVEVTVR
jgi:hypothetical protein